VKKGEETNANILLCLYISRASINFFIVHFRGALMKKELQKLSEMKLSNDLFEVVNRGLK
jgi:hypothetical protein